MDIFILVKAYIVVYNKRVYGCVVSRPVKFSAGHFYYKKPL